MTFVAYFIILILEYDEDDMNGVKWHFLHNEAMYTYFTGCSF